MKVAILGTRGIPNNYGGFEQWAEQLSVGLINKDCEVIVYNSHFHPYKQKLYKGVKIIHVWDPKSLGLASQFIYDLLCIVDARKRNFDTIIQLGYTTSSVWAFLLPKKAKIIYNMDGIEWKRAKYKGLLKPFLKYAEKLAVNNSDIIIADSKPIKDYLNNKYNRDINFIPYSANISSKFNKDILAKYNLQEKQYFLLIARFQPDNNLETIILGYNNSKTNFPLVIVGDNDSKYGRQLKKKYSNKNTLFLGKIYDNELLSSLRKFCFMYFHGHSAGGTNPSLLEAMANSCTINAHNNEFNESVLGNDAFYFRNDKEITICINTEGKEIEKSQWHENNIRKLHNDYNLNFLVDKYFKLLK